MRKKFLFAVSSAVLSLVSVGTAQAQDKPGNIVEVASANPDFSTLVTAVKAAELVETLSGEGPFTVFAPTNAAFEALPAGTLDTLLADPKGALTDILKLHVIGGAVDSKAAIAAAGTNVDTLGGPVAVALDGETLTIGGAKVVTTDIQASNGVIHVIDAVITAPAGAAAAPAADTEAMAAGDTEAMAAETEAAAPAADTEAMAAPDTEAMAAADTEAAVPSAVATGDDGLAANGGSNTMLLLVGVLALAGIAVSSTVLLKARKKN
jgi:transforming growth factor-beta-induced protein